MELVDLNVCKNNFCDNFGITKAKEFTGPVYRLGFRAFHCKKCGSYPPVLDSDGFTKIWAKRAEILGKLTASICPNCASTARTRFGISANGKTRFRCKDCLTTYTRWTPKTELKSVLAKLELSLENSNCWLQYLTESPLKRNQLDRLLTQFSNLKQQERYDLESAQRVATYAWTVPYKGKTQGAQNKLWLLCSCDVDTGKVILLTSTWCPFLLPSDSLYDYTQTPYESEDHNLTLNCQAMELAEKRSQVFWERPQFDQLNYGPSSLQAKGESICKPVLAAHAHWRTLNTLGHGKKKGHHYLYHEVFLRGACMTQFADQVKAGECAVYYVSGRNEHETGQLIEARTLGWWQNRWYQFNNGHHEYAVSALVPDVPLADIAKATLSPCHQFINELNRQGWMDIFKYSSPLRVNALLQCLATQFNQTL